MKLRYTAVGTLLFIILLFVALLHHDVKQRQQILVASGMGNYEMVPDGCRFEILSSMKAPFDTSELTSSEAISEPVVPSADGPAWLVVYVQSWLSDNGRAYVFSSDGGNAVEYKARADDTSVVVVGGHLRRLTKLQNLSDVLQNELIRREFALGHARYDPSKSPF